MTDRVAWMIGSANKHRRAVGRTIALAVASTFITFTACNRAVPEKTVAKGEETEQSAGLLLNKEVAPILPPDAKGSSTEAAANNNPSGSASTQAESAPPSPTANQNAGDKGAPAAPPAAPPAATSLTIENVASLSPNVDQPVAEPEPNQNLADRSFMKLELPNAILPPDQLIAFLVDCDRAVQELIIANQAKQLKEKLFIETAKRLSTMKLTAGERIYADATATLAQKKTAIAAQVESLSQLTGLGDVEAAQKLLKVAGQLTESPDPQLAHQGRLVLIGFRLNQLVEGQIKDPQVILNDVNDILDKSAYRSLVELLALQQSYGVLNQLGYAEQAAQVQKRIVKEFRDSSDRELARRSWTIEVGNSPELKTVIESIQNTLAGTEKDPNKVAEQAQAFIKAYPSLNTVAYFLSVIVDLEYSGRAEASRRLSSVIAQAKSSFPEGPFSADIDNVLDGQKRRLSALGKQLVLDELTGMDGAPFDWNAYQKKVVLVYFWASWELPSMNLIDQIRKLRGRIQDPGFAILGICTDDGRTINDAGTYVSRQALDWRNLRSSNPAAIGLETKAAKMLGVNAYSHFAMLVDKQGKVVAVHPSFENLDSMIQELLSGP